MEINYELIIIVMLFVILMSIQFTLNKIYLILKEIRQILMLKKIRNDDYDRFRIYKI